MMATATSTQKTSFVRAIAIYLTLFVSSVAAQITSPILFFQGTVLNDLGESLEGALVQFWHTDPNGNYRHPEFQPDADLLDEFQYFGTAETGADGNFTFITFRPGVYPQRPVTHIHCKVWWEGADILTSQFYFRDENTDFPEALQLDVVPYANGTTLVTKTIVVNLGLGGSEPITPSQQAGPFYPVVDFFGFDNDLTMVSQVEEQLGMPMTNPPSSIPSSFPTLFSNDTITSTTAPSTSPTNMGTTTTTTTMQPTALPTVTTSTTTPTAIYEAAEAGPLDLDFESAATFFTSESIRCSMALTLLVGICYHAL